MILPLEHNVHRRWSTKRASEEEKNMQPMQQIKGVVPIREMLQASNEENLMHPTQESHEPFAQSTTTRLLPTECEKWDYSVCFSLMKFDSPIKYAAFLGD